jgi:hypothetical protein
MHCPRCGTIAGAGQQFCRSCGVNLEKVAELIGESSALETRGAEDLRLKDLQRKHESWGGVAGLIALGLSLVLFIAIVFTQIIMRGGLLILPGSLLILLALAAGVMGYFQSSAKALKQKLAQTQLPQTTETPAHAQPINLSGIRTPASVTEQTTRLLEEQSERSTGKIAS